MVVSTLALVLVACAIPEPFAEQVQEAYSSENPQALRSLLSEATNRADSLLVRYRLYPLTEDAEVLKSIPEHLEDGSAREWALLSGLWSYRAGEASMLNAMRYGRRSVDLLETARSLDPDNPYVLLIGGQSLLFRPAVAGQDAEEAARRFQRLVEVVSKNPGTGIAKTEARMWEWLALRSAGQSDSANELRETLLSTNPPPLYEAFIHDPPSI